MLTRIRILACGFALGVGMLLLGATAAHATPQSGAHVSGQPGGSDSASWSPSGGCHHHYCQTPTPTPKPKPTCTSKPKPTSPASTPTPTSPASTPPAPLTTATPTAVPTGGANTGGGGSIGGGGPDMPLVTGGAALALGSVGLGLFAYRRYRKPVA
jgi:hypothetical protein